jgi:DNA polymerase-3 subunit epsilon
MGEILILGIIGIIVYFLFFKKKGASKKSSAREKERIHTDDCIKTVIGRDLNFTSFDFETATKNPTSACSLAVTVVRNGKIMESMSWLINPGLKRWNSSFIDIHGITPEKVEFVKGFKDLWPEIKKYFDGQVLAGHNVNFDENVLNSLLEKHKIDFYNFKTVDSIKWMKHFFSELPSFSLGNLASYLNIELDHHNAESDSLVCAKLILLCSSLTDYNTIDEIQNKVANEAKRKGYKKSFKESNFILDQEVEISFTSENHKSKSYEDAVNFANSLNCKTEKIEPDISQYTITINTKDEADLRYLLSLTTNWKSRRINVNEMEVKQGELTSALWFSKLTDEEREYSDHIDREKIYGQSENNQKLIEHFEAIRKAI